MGGGHARRGFTLIELLVVVSIILVLTLFVVSIFRNDGGSKMREAARIGQAAIMGARDRALYAKERRGIRLVLDPNDSSQAIGFLYVAQIVPPPMSVQLERPDTNSDGIADSPGVTIARVYDTSLQYYWLNDLMNLVPRVRIPSVTTPTPGPWFTVLVPAPPASPFVTDTSTQIFTLTVDASTKLTVTNPFPSVVAIPRTNSNAFMDIEVANELLPNHPAIPLPSGVIIDLSVAGTMNGTYDLMFNPRGTITGAPAALGPVYFLLRDVRDAGKDPAAAQFDQQVLALFPQTGHVAAYPVDPTDIDGTPGADHPFYFAQTGNRSGG
jgi:prepilin-type N-terminal cleavage/methylation domain-containing protein